MLFPHSKPDFAQMLPHPKIKKKPKNIKRRCLIVNYVIAYNSNVLISIFSVLN